MKLNLAKPLVFFDLETTGINIAKDRIVEISVLKCIRTVRRNKRPSGESGNAYPRRSVCYSWHLR